MRQWAQRAALVAALAVVCADEDGWARVAQHGIPVWPRPTAAQRAAERTLRERIASGEIGVKLDSRARPRDYAVDEAHLSVCTSCFEDEYRARLHSRPLAPRVDAAQPLVDDFAIERFARAARSYEAPRRERLPNLTCPGACELTDELSQINARRNHFGFYGTVLRDVRPGGGGERFRMWLGEWEPYYSHSADGVRWATPLRPLRRPGADGGLAAMSVCVTRDPARGRLLMAYNCGNKKLESVCIAAAADADGRAGLDWSPLGAGATPRMGVPDGARCAQLDACCGAPCIAHADSYSCVRARADGSHVLVKRWGFGTNASPKDWRATRGVLVARNARLDVNVSGFETVRAWYFDREGKHERYRRQLYSLTLSAPGEVRGDGDGDGDGDDELTLGLATVFEWPRLGSIRHPDVPTRPPYAHDVMNVYLLSSRDGGVLHDLSSVYAGAPLLAHGGCGTAGGVAPRRPEECDFDHGYVQPASELITTPEWHLLYYEGRHVRHEQRWLTPATIALARWARDRLAGIRADPVAASPATCGGAQCAVVETRAFAVGLGVRTLALNMRAHSPSAIRVELLDSSGGAVLGTSSPLGGDSARVRVSLRDAGGVDVALSHLRGQHVRLRFHLSGEAALFAFVLLSAR